jgi:DNA helicase HerA-like ATPase
MDLQIPETSIIFDISLLTPLEQQRTVEVFCQKLFQYQLNSNKRFYLVFEEAQIYFPLNSIRAKRYQYTTRVLTVGRNVGISICAISQFPSLIDCELRKNAQQIYVGCSSEPNTLAYWKGILGKNADQLKDLQNGEFLYYCRNKLSKIQIEPYENHTTKTRIAIPEPIIQPIPQPKQNNTHTISTLITAFLWFTAILLALHGRGL